MHFESEAHEAQYAELLENGPEGGQRNERRSSLYVIAALPGSALLEFKKQKQLEYATLLEEIGGPESGQRPLSPSETKLVRLAYALYHGGSGEEVVLRDYLGWGNEWKRLFMQALALHFDMEHGAFK